MVNLGRSKGCNTCRRRRVKCDEAKPACARCQRSGIPCLGYQRNDQLSVRFKDQTQLISSRFRPEPIDAGASRYDRSLRPAPALPYALSESYETVAVNFFLRSFLTYGRSYASSRGLFENIIPTLSTVTSDSPVALAVSSIGTLLLNSWRRESGRPELALRLYGQTLRRLQLDLQSPSAAKAEATFLAILLLQFHENLSSVLGLSKAARTHHEGALVLVRRLPPSTFESDTSKRLLLYLLNTELSSAIRECRIPPLDLVERVRSIAETMSLNPSNKLDQIGVQVAEIQVLFTQLPQGYCGCASPAGAHIILLIDLYKRAIRLQSALSAWEQSVPDHWQPRQWEPPTPSFPAIQMYRGICEIYPSIQIAAIWNTWRGYCLIVYRILVRIHASKQPDILSLTPQLPDDPIEPAAIELLQAVIDAICYSVPFHLGNRTQPRGMLDLTQPEFECPAYYNLRTATISQEPIMPAEEHKRHLVTQGGWHALIPLSQVVAQFSGNRHDCDCISDVLRAGQLEWIRGQLLRSVFLLALDKNKFMSSTVVDHDAEGYAARVRDGLRLTCGL
ncbi:hypothetical protein K505DRAFT_282272 [Melanomma pulvis-pyrius CBS 109.77]|uniref:Zn(2)-C6 fungal-type domain-containing protein n=1 Tax=Melanomma pulvis-pyrius CBS 109.77 TaxID=1314802 RepID=A0A6A6X327_9PLEO|nr:hypothetical protein K505DRAFT_282272 [Melanomma pulvis-pyrius CBS 109.77]